MEIEKQFCRHNGIALKHIYITKVLRPTIETHFGYELSRGANINKADSPRNDIKSPTGMKW